MTYAEKTHLLDDDAADALVEYARALSLADSADTVTLRAIDSHGNQVEATFLLNRSSMMLVESTNSEFPGPDNSETVTQMRQSTTRLLDPPAVGPDARGHEGGLPEGEYFDG